MGKQRQTEVAVAILDADHKILLGKRKDIYGVQTWSLPGGLLKPDETLQECLLREVNQEVGIQLLDIGLLDISEITDAKEQFIEIAYACNKWEGIIALQPSKYFSEWKFFDIDRIPHGLFTGHQSFIHKIITQIRGDDHLDTTVESLLATIHPHFKVSVDAFVLNDKDQLLMGLRCDDFDGGNWAVPGGHLDVGETLSDCVLRELWEETGIEASTAQQFTYVEQPITISNKHYFHFGFIIKDFTYTTLINGETEDISRWEWFDLDKIPSNLAQSQREMIIKFLKFRHFTFGKK